MKSSEELAAAHALIPRIERTDSDDGETLLRDIRNFLHRNAAAHDAILRDFVPKRTVVAYKFDGATYANPVQYNIPKSVLGGIYLENRTGTTAHVYLGENAFGEPYIDIPAGTFKALPVNKWGMSETLVTVSLDAASAGRVLLVLSSEPLGPSEGNVVGAGAAQTNVNVQTLFSGPAVINQNYSNAAALNVLRTLTLYLMVSGATTITVEISPDNINWYQATIDDSQTAASVQFPGAGTTAISIPPAQYVRVRSSAAVNVTAQLSGG